MTVDDRPSFKTYGGWRRTRGYGVFGLGTVSSIIVFGCLFFPIICFAFTPVLGLIAIVPAGLIIAIMVTKVDGVPIGNYFSQRLQWWWGSWWGYTSLRSGIVVEHQGAWQLPGVLATTKLISVEDPGADRFGIVWDRRTGFMTATLKCSASSTGLVDPREAQSWVENWHEWLASLGYMPAVSHVNVTVDTAPEPGSTLADCVFSRLDPHAPDDTRALMQELVWRSPAAAADVDTRVSITFNPRLSGFSASTLEEQTADISRQLVGLEASLARCGVAVLGRAADYELAGIVRSAFDPVVRGEVNRLVNSPLNMPQQELKWEFAGPIAAEEKWGSYQHDSGISVSWAWHEPPRQGVTSDVLTRLLSPGSYPKRVSLLFRPLPAGVASRVLETEVNAAAFRQQWRKAQKRDETARDQADRTRVQKAAQEEAEGSGLVMVSLYATVTVTNEDDLPAAIADVEARADQSKIRLRRLFGSQALGFAATLPGGICPPLLAAGAPHKGR